MASNPNLYIMFLTTLFFTTMMIPTTPQSCNSYPFPNNHYTSCNDLPTLESSLYWNYNPNTGTVDIENAKDSSWIAWAINPTSKGMIGSQSLVPFRRSDGSFKAYTSLITSYATTLQEGNLSFPVYNVSGVYVNGSMIIFASFGLPGNTTLVNHLGQEGLVSDDGSLRPHAFSGPNVQSFGTLDFASRAVSKSGASAAKVINSRTTLRIAHGFLNAINWGILIPIGVILARYLKTFDGLRPIWFHMHRACQSLALLVLPLVCIWEIIMGFTILHTGALESLSCVWHLYKFVSLCVSGQRRITSIEFSGTFFTT